MKKMILLLLLTTMTSSVYAQKIIEIGWDSLTPEILQKNLQEIEKRPFDGVAIHVTGKNEKGTLTLTWLHGTTAKKHEWFQDTITLLKNLKFQRLTDNFIIVGANPGNIDWFDDPGWEIIIANWKLAAAIAKEVGFKGIMFDPEAYCPPYNQFKYICQSGREQHNFQQYQSKARERGRQVMEAIITEYPDITLFSLFMYTYNFLLQPGTEAWSFDHSLQPAFFDGMLDAASPSVTFVDGNERVYAASQDQDYLQGRLEVKKHALAYVTPENRQKYQAQVQYAPAFFLDSYGCTKAHRAKNMYGLSPMEKFYQDLVSAARYSDGYIWIYGERYRWWPTTSKNVMKQSWSEIYPDCDTAMFMVRNPQAYVEKWFQQKKYRKCRNQLANAQFKEVNTKGNLPKDWEVNVKPSWQSKEVVSLQNGRIKLSQAWCWAGLSQICHVVYGKRYAIRVKTYKTGMGHATVRISYLDANDIPLHSNWDNVFSPDADGRIIGMVSVPENAKKMVVTLGAEGQRTSNKNDQIWFETPELYQMPPLADKINIPEKK